MEKDIKEYLAWKGTYASRASVMYKLWLYRFIEVNGNRQLKDYTMEHIVNFKHWLDSRFRSSTVQYAIIVIKNFLKFQQQNNRRCLSASLIRIPPATKMSHQAIGERDYQIIIGSITPNNFISMRDLLLLRMLWDTGVRVSELCDINLSQITEEGLSISIKTKKSQQNRIIVWSKETHKILLRYLPLRRELEKVNGGNALFIGRQKGRWSLRLTSRSVERIVKHRTLNAQIYKKISPHSFRHGWAHYRRDRNASLAFIQKGLGHKSPMSTFIYEQYNDKEFEARAGSYFKKLTA